MSSWHDQLVDNLFSRHVKNMLAADTDDFRAVFPPDNEVNFVLHVQNAFIEGRCPCHLNETNRTFSHQMDTEFLHALLTASISSMVTGTHGYSIMILFLTIIRPYLSTLRTSLARPSFCSSAHL